MAKIGQVSNYKDQIWLQGSRWNSVESGTDLAADTRDPLQNGRVAATLPICSAAQKCPALRLLLDDRGASRQGTDLSCRPVGCDGA